MAVRMTRAGVALTVGIIVLTGLIIGGLFWAKNTGEQARREEAIAIAEQNLEEESDEEIVLNEGNASEEQNGQSSGEVAQEATPDVAPETTPETSTVSELPQTGPSNGAAIVSIGLLTFLGVSYYQSRRTETHTV